MLWGESLTSLPWTHWAVAAAAVIVIGVAKSGFGGGVGILAVPMFVWAMGPKLGLGAMLPLLLVADVFSVCHHWGTWDRQNLRVMLPGSIVGVVIGTLILAWLLNGSVAGDVPVADGGADTGASQLAAAEQKFKVAIGVICVLYAVGSVVRSRYASHWRWTANWSTGTAAGASTGIVSTLAHAGGPVATIYLLGQHLPKQGFIGTTVIYFFILNVLKLAPYGWLGMIDTTTLLHGLWLLPLVPVGTFAGAHLNRVMSEDVFRNTIMVIVFLTGLKMVFSP